MISVFLFTFLMAVSVVEHASSTIAGMISTSTGMPVAGAHVIVKNTTSALSEVLFTAPDGSYTAASLLPGEYEIEVQAPGYRTSRRTLTLEKSDSLRRNFVLGSATRPELVSDPAALEIDPPQSLVKPEPEVKPCPEPAPKVKITTKRARR